MTRISCLAILAEAYDAGLASRDAGPRPWGRALRRWHIVQHVVWAVVGRWWDPQYGPPPGRKSGPATSAVGEHLRRLVDKHWDDIEALCRAGISLSAVALEELATQGVRVPPSELSERVAVRAGAAYRGSGLVPGPADQPAMVADLVESYLRARSDRLTKAEFREHLTQCYDQEWDRRGADCLAAFRPSSVGLGDDVRPALAPRAERGGWFLGLNRSIWGRHRMYSIRSAVSRSSPPADDNCRSHEEHERRRNFSGVEQLELAREEVRRACSPYGLAADEHRGVVLAISHGLDLAESVVARLERSATWSGWTTSRCSTLSGEIARTAAASKPDPTLVAAIRDFTGLWRASPAGRLVEEWYGPLTGQLDLILTAVVRKTWMDLHRREREHVEPMRRAHVARAIRVAFCCGVPEALLRRRHGQVTVPGADAGGEVVVDDDRRNSTFGILLDYPDEVASWREMTLSGDLNWIARYEEIIDAKSDVARSEAEKRYLTSAELARIFGEDWSDPE